MNVGLFLACFNDALFPKTGKSTYEVLSSLGCNVDFPTEQTCCGQLQYNTGYQAQSLGLAKRFVEIFSHYDAIVSPSSSCVLMIRDGYTQMAEDFSDPILTKQFAAIADKTFELCEFITQELGVNELGAYYPHRVTYHPTCSSLRGLKLGGAALQLLENVEGLELLPLNDADECCGFGGAFSVKNEPVSSAMLQDKINNIIASDAELCCAVDNSCLMHIGGGLSRLGLAQKTIHIADILASKRNR